MRRGEKGIIASPSRSSHGCLSPSPFSLRYRGRCWQSRGCPASPALCSAVPAGSARARPQLEDGTARCGVPRELPGPPGHLRVSEGPPAASGGHGLGRGNRQPEPGRGAGRAVAFRAAGQSAQISLICVTPMNKIARRQPGTIQREPLSEGGRFSGAAGARASVTCLPSAIRQLRTQSTGPSLHTVARRAVLPVPRAVRTVTLCVLWCCSSCCSYSLKSRSPLSEQCILPFHSYRHMCAVFSLLNSSSIEFLKKKNIYIYVNWKKQ